MKQKIIVTGYPKSGNTWLTRLVAEIVRCPVKGFLYSDHNEIATEGENRVSNFECYKSHHQFNELKEFDQNHSILIYIIRDPRDISLSGRNYFDFKFDESIPPIIFKFSILRIYFRKYFREKFINRKMNRAILYGDKDLSWCYLPWINHVQTYLKEEKVLIIQYENLKKNPMAECERIIDYIGISRTTKELDDAILKQSFKQRKKKANLMSDKLNSRFLRSGEIEQWRAGMTNKEKRLFSKELGIFLKRLGYSD
jgi:hypothetical protein